MEKRIALAVVMAYKIDSMKYDAIGHHHDTMLLADNAPFHEEMGLIEKHNHSNIMESLEEAFKICELPASLAYPLYLADYWSNDLIDWAEELSGVSFCKVSLLKDQASCKIGRRSRKVDNSKMDLKVIAEEGK